MKRREFLKKSAMAGGAVAMATAVTSKQSLVAEAAGTKIGVKKHKGKTLKDLTEIKSGRKPFKKNDIIFERARVNKEFPFARLWAPDKLDNNEPGWGHLDYALVHGARISWGADFFYHLKDAHSVDPNNPQYEFKTPQEAATHVKRVAKIYKADDVGIAPFDDQWTYQENIEEFNELGFKPKSVIVMLIKMNTDLMYLNPTMTGQAAPALAYSNMAEIGGKVAAFLSSLGYKSYAGGNDWGLSVPYAIEAGLGEGNRFGLLTHPVFGPCCRIVKVYTELDMQRDYPITFGVKEFCKVCMKCADACPSQAVTRKNESFNEDLDKSVDKKVKKWTTDAITCFKFWDENRTDCGRCIAVCPYTKHDVWHHQMSRVAAGVPGVRNIARFLDDFFGYGEDPTGNNKMFNRFWENIDVD